MHGTARFSPEMEVRRKHEKENFTIFKFRKAASPAAWKRKWPNYCAFKKAAKPKALAQAARAYQWRDRPPSRCLKGRMTAPFFLVTNLGKKFGFVYPKQF